MTQSSATRAKDKQGWWGGNTKPITFEELLLRITSVAGISESFRFATPANPYTVLVRLDMSTAPPDPKTSPQRHAFELLWERGYRAVLAKNTSIPRKGDYHPCP